MNMYTSRRIGQIYAEDYRSYIEKDGKVVSPWHDIPLYHDIQSITSNMIVEIPRWSNAKYEISREEFLNPIKQDVKEGKPRFVHNCYPFKGYPWNYGAIPQTWEDPSNVLPSTSTHGDNDPLDVLDISSNFPIAAQSGQVKCVKPLGALCVLDEGETDWKIIAIDVEDPLAPNLHDIEDVEMHMPGLLDATKEWFRGYKVPAGKARNPLAFEGEYKNREYAANIITECNESWRRLIEGSVDQSKISMYACLHLVCTSSSASANKSMLDYKSINTSLRVPNSVATEEDIVKIPDGRDISPATIDPSSHEWSFAPQL